MGLDFGLQRKRVDEGFEGSGWEDLWFGRNCHRVRDLFFDIIEGDISTETVTVGVGTIAAVLKHLSEDFSANEVVDIAQMNASTYKLLDAIANLSHVLYNITIDTYDEDNPPTYIYRVVNSY